MGKGKNASTQTNKPDVTIKVETSAKATKTEKKGPSRGARRRANKRANADSSAKPVLVAKGDYSNPFSTPAGGKPNGNRSKTGLPAVACSLFRPFDECLDGIKTHDDDVRWTATCRDKNTFTVTTTANNNLSDTAAYYVFMADPVQYAVTMSSNTSVWSAPATFTNATVRINSTALKTQCSLIRPVCGGVRITALQGVSIAGMVYTALVPHDLSGTTWQGMPTGNDATIISAMTQLPEFKATPLSELGGGKYLEIAYRKTDRSGDTYRQFTKDSGSTLAPWNSSSNEGVLTSNPGWYDVIVYINGLNQGISYAVINEILHEEYIPRANAFLIEPSPPAASQPLVASALANFAAMVPATQVVNDSGGSGDEGLDGMEWGGYWGTAVNIAKTAAPLLLSLL